jgi:hypothetical protein
MDPYIAHVLKLLDQNKALAAFLAPLVVGLATMVANWIVTGEFSTNELRIAVGTALLSAVSGLGTYVTPTKTAVVQAIPGASRPREPVVPPADAGP